MRRHYRQWCRNTVGKSRDESAEHTATGDYAVDAERTAKPFNQRARATGKPFSRRALREASAPGLERGNKTSRASDSTTLLQLYTCARLYTAPINVQDNGTKVYHYLVGRPDAGETFCCLEPPTSRSATHNIRT